MTLAELAEASKVSVGLLSRLENGVGNPYFAALSAIARVLDVDVSSFFEPPANGEIVLASDARIRLRALRTDVELELLVPNFRSRIIGMLLTLPPGSSPPQVWNTVSSTRCISSTLVISFYSTPAARILVTI
jgi:transcriptional regulator with XRE-family HTH domain